MFNTYENHHHDSPVTNITVKQQPNDAADAARLFGQLKDKASEEFASGMVNRLGADNEVVFLQCDHFKDPLLDKLHVRLVFKINGKLYDIITENTMFHIKQTIFGSVMEEVFKQATKQLINIEKQITHRI